VSDGRRYEPALRVSAGGVTALYPGSLLSGCATRSTCPFFFRSASPVTGVSVPLRGLARPRSHPGGPTAAGPSDPGRLNPPGRWATAPSSPTTRTCPPSQARQSRTGVFEVRTGRRVAAGVAAHQGNAGRASDPASRFSGLRPTPIRPRPARPPGPLPAGPDRSSGPAGVPDRAQRQIDSMTSVGSVRASRQRTRSGHRMAKENPIDQEPAPRR
jgi:hypothetical protein